MLLNFLLIYKLKDILLRMPIMLILAHTSLHGKGFAFASLCCAPLAWKDVRSGFGEIEEAFKVWDAAVVTGRMSAVGY
jgi:hypothetical protein